MNYENFVKKLVIPDGFDAPKELKFDNLIAKPLSRSDLKEDLAAVNSSIEIIQKTRGGSWPEESISEEFDLLDLAWHEREFRDADSFAYVIYDGDNNYVGCFYLYSLGQRTVLTEKLLGYEVDASWWVTTKAYEQGYYGKLYLALQKWLEEDFGFSKVYYSNKEIPS